MRLLSKICVVMLFLALNSVCAQSVKKLIGEETIHFESGSAVISENEMAYLDSLLKQLQLSFSNYSVEVFAFTDNVGDEVFNKNLSQKRANAAVDFLKSKSISAQKISIKALGETNPLSDNVSETGRLLNRRATIKFYDNSDSKIAIGGFGLDETNYSINPEKEQVVTYQSGTKITIPNDPFVDKNGNPIKGEVALSYIEYRDPVDFILGNIPMDFHQDGQNYTFNSGGMFKILASQNGNEVFLRKDKNIDLDFKLVEELPDLNFYRFDTEEKKWTELSKLTESDQQEDSTTTSTVSWKRNFIGIQNDTIMSYSVYTECDYWLNNIDLGAKLASDTTSLYRRFFATDKKNLRLFRKEIARNEMRIKNLENKILLYQKQSELNKSHCEISEAKTGKDEVGFKINVAGNPNLDSRIGKFIWITPEINTMKDSGLYTKKWLLSALISQENNSCTIVLKSEDTTLEIKNAKPTFEDEVAIKSQNYLLKYVEAVLKNQSTKMENALVIAANFSEQKTPLELKNVRLKKYYLSPSNSNGVKSLENFWTISKNNMTIAELAMTEEEWFEYFDKNKSIMLERYTALKNNPQYAECEKQRERKYITQKQMTTAQNSAQEVTKSLQISTLGIFNCDQIQRLLNPVEVLATYKDENGNAIEPLFIYVVDSRINGILRYDGGYNYSPFRFAYSPTSKTTLLAFDAKGEAYIYDAEKFKSINPTDKLLKHTFVVSKIKNINNKSELSALLQ